MDDFRAIVEDIEWLRSEWWERQAESLTEGHIRRGSTTLHLLLVQGLAGTAWRQLGFSGEPIVEGPDIIALAAQQNLRLDQAASLVAGGGRINDLDIAFIGGFRIDNPTTGVPAEAAEGFSVCVTSVARDARSPKPNVLDSLVHRKWTLSQYRESAGAVRRGSIITRREIIDYFRNYAGGAHYDLLTGTKNAKTAQHELTRELEKHIHANTWDGLYFELLSIGQAFGRSPDMITLVNAVRRSRSA